MAHLCISKGPSRLKMHDRYNGAASGQHCYPLIFVGAVIAVGSMSKLLSGWGVGLQVLFPDLANSFTSYQLLVKDEH